MSKSSMKKTLSVMLAVTTLVWMMSLSLTAFAQSFVINEGDLVRGPDGIKVYIVKPFAHGSYVGYKRHIFNPAVFNMYQHFDWNNIHAVSQETLDSYQTSDLYRTDGDTKVYGMNEIDEAAGVAQKRWVNMSGEEFITEGYDWAQIFTINNEEANFYSTGSDILVGGVVLPPVGIGALNVSLAADTPGSMVIAASTAYNSVLKVNVSAGSQNGSFTGVTVTKYGLSSNSNVNGVSIWDSNGMRHGNIMTSWTSDNKMTVSFPSDPINVPANTSTYFLVKVNVSTATSGTMYFGIASQADIASAGSVGGSFPVSGNVMSLTSGSSSLGAYTVTAQAVGGAAALSTTVGNVNIGDAQKEVGKFQFQSDNSNEDLSIERVVVYVDGSFIEGTDVRNWNLVDNGGSVLASAVGAVDRFVTFTLASPYVVPKGTNKILSVKADILDGATRYFRVGIQNDYDVMVRGTTTGFYVLDSALTTVIYGSTPYFNIGQGALTVTKSVDSPSGELAPGSTGVVLAKFDLKSSGEQMEIRNMDLYFATGATTVQLSGTVRVQNVSGSQTYLSVAATDNNLYVANLATRYALSQYINLTSGQTLTIVVVGDVSTTATAGSYTANIGNFYAKRFSTNDYTNFNAATATPANSRAVTVGGLNLNTNSAWPTTKTYAAGTTNAILGSYVMQATSAEDVRISNIAFTWDTQTATPATDLTNMWLEVGGVAFGSVVGTVNGTSNTFSGSYTVPKSGTVIMNLKANIVSTATGTFVSKLAVGAISGVGLLSGTTIANTGAVTGQTAAVTTGTLTVTKDSSASGSKVLTAGLSMVELNKLNFAATVEDMTLTKIALSVPAGSADSFSTIYLKDGATTIGSTTLFGSDAVFSGLNVAIPADGTKVLGVFADITASGVMTPAATSAIGLRGTAQTTDFVVQKASGGELTSITSSTLALGNTFLFHNSAPTLALAADSPSGTKSGAAGQEVAKFTVYNGGTKDMRMASLAVTVAPAGLGTGGQVTGFELWDGTSKLTTTTTATFATSTVVTFDKENDNSGALDNFVISAGTTKTFTVKADTTNMRTGLTSGQNSSLTLTIAGSTGFVQGDTLNETNWADGGLTYFYTPTGGSPVGPYSAADQYPVSGNTLTY